MPSTHSSADLYKAQADLVEISGFSNIAPLLFLSVCHVNRQKARETDEHNGNLSCSTGKAFPTSPPRDLDLATTNESANCLKGSHGASRRERCRGSLGWPRSLEQFDDWHRCVSFGIVSPILQADAKVSVLVSEATVPGKSSRYGCLFFRGKCLYKLQKPAIAEPKRR